MLRPQPKHPYSSLPMSGGYGCFAPPAVGLSMTFIGHVSTRLFCANRPNVVKRAKDENRPAQERHERAGSPALFGGSKKL